MSVPYGLPSDGQCRNVTAPDALKATPKARVASAGGFELRPAAMSGWASQGGPSLRGRREGGGRRDGGFVVAQKQAQSIELIEELRREYEEGTSVVWAVTIIATGREVGFTLARRSGRSPTFSTVTLTSSGGFASTRTALPSSHRRRQLLSRFHRSLRRRRTLGH